ncbi:MAG: DUF1700 domain-containing protein [Clostridia bacterium]
MTKKEFLSELAKSLKRFPQNEVDKSIDFYSELIDDKIEDGISEEEAVESLGSPTSVAGKIIDESPFRALYTSAKLENDGGNSSATTTKSRQFPTWAIVLLSVTAIVWVPLAFALTVTVWAVVFALIATVLAMVVSGVVFLVASPIAFAQLGSVGGFMVIGLSMIAIGLGIFAIFGAIYLFKGVVSLSKKIFNSSKQAINKGGKN